MFVMSPQTVMVVDDEVHIVNVVVMNLKRAGYRVLTARDPQQALELARRERPDLVITDHNMPGGSGLDLCRMLRGTAETAEIPAILLTAYDFSVLEEAFDNGNVCAVIPKPFSPRELMGRVENILQAGARQ